jgi:hypothetical protein
MFVALLIARIGVQGVLVEPLADALRPERV